MSLSNNHSPRHDNLPVPFTKFIGRKHEITRVKELLSDHRLVTLSGSGGCGKTRLGLRVASELQGHFPDGIWLTEFASIAEAELVTRAVAATLGVREQAERPISETLMSHLKSYEVLLILDNCEHLVDAVAQLSASLLESCPEIHILATSREPLGVPGEMVWTVPPLSLPDPQPWRGPGGEQVALVSYQQSEAMQLFAVRAAAASPGFQLNAENASWVAGICRRLDGIPLAIELAAARLRAFTVRQIAERLDDRFHLLTSRLRTVPLRHQTLEAALDWSFQLLLEPEQIILRRLSVFAGEWTLEAAEAVCSGGTAAGGSTSAGGITPTEVMDEISSLVDKSFVVVGSSPDTRRYRYLETIRQYAHEKLVEAGEVTAVRDRHLDYFLNWVEMNAAHLSGPEQSAWLESFAAEHDNIRFALEWSHSSPDRAALGLRLAAACGRFWRLHGDFREGRERLNTMLRLSDPQEHTNARAWALLWSANLAYLQTDYPAVQALAQEGLEISRQLGTEGELGVARALDLLGELATEIGDYKTAAVLIEDALNIYRALHEKRGIAEMLMQLGWAAMRDGDYARAETLINESLPLIRELEESSLLGEVLSGLGELAVRLGKYEQANRLLEESLALRRALNERWGVAASLGTLGWAALLQRDYERMREVMGESLSIRIEIGERGGTAWCLEKLAEAAILQAQSLPNPHRRHALQRAVQVFAAAASLRAPLQSTIDPADQPEYERILRDLRGTLGETAFESDWDEGVALPLAEVVDLALTPALSPIDAASLSSAQVDKAKYGGLTAQERTVAVWIAKGNSNREIAKVMNVQVKTVETYVTRILNKLGFDSRVQIATWVLEIGLQEQEAH